MQSRPMVAATALASLFLASVRAQLGWPEIFDPLVLRTIHLQMSNADWQTIQHDETFEIEVPTWMWLDGESPILVSIRRKSADPLIQAPNYVKVSYKIDINELVAGQNWHGLRAVSLDNGDDQDVVSEGLAWYLHRRASGPEGYGYDAGLASWVRLVINGVDTGVYVNAEQRDKRFLENRGLWVNNETWLYEVEDLHGFEMDEGGPGDSPTVLSLCYSPFASPSTCATPSPATLAAVLPGLVDMQGLLALAAVDAFTANPDAIFSHGKNFYFADWLSGRRRLHFPWDLDSALRGGGINSNVYAPQSSYSSILLNVPQFRAQYSQILNDLVCGPFQVPDLHAFLDALEPVLSTALAADPNNQLGGSVASFFAGRKAWLAQRRANIIAQLENFVPCHPHLFVDPLRSGTTVDSTVTDANPGEPVLFAYSLTGVGSGPCFAVLGGLCVDLLDPLYVLGIDGADASGTAVIALPLPLGLPPITVSLQAVIPRGPGGVGSVKTNTVTRTIS